MNSTDFGKQLQKTTTDGTSSSFGELAGNEPNPKPSEKDATHYNMNHKYRGIALIFNHEKYDKILGLKDRTGTKTDVESMTKILKELGFKVQVRKDNKLTTLKDNIKKTVKVDHTDYDCFVMVVLTHGTGQDMLYACDEIYSSEVLWKSFTADICPSLAGKPKIFIVQACWGPQEMSAVTVGETKTDNAFNTTYKIPSHADFLFAYSSIPGYVSYRDPETGTWFIEALCNEFRMNVYKYDILSLLTFVIRRVAVDKIIKQGEKKQIPFVTTTLTRLVQFNKKINANADNETCQALEKLALN